MRSRFAMAALALTLAVGACDSDSPTNANNATDNQQNTPEFKKEAKLLKDVVVTGTTVADVGGAPGVFNGKVTITRFDYTEAGGLTVSGVIKDAAGTVKQTFTNIPARLTGQGAPTAPVCSILDLDIGAIHLDLLGLVVDLAPIHLDITAESGAGNLLGNLLCALAGLLDPPGPLAQILDLLQQINAILAGL